MPLLLAALLSQASASSGVALFEDVSARACKYSWVGERYSRADKNALTAKVGSGALAAACGGRRASPDIGNVHAIPHLDVIGHAGSVGCDVCGILRDRNVWVILPAERIGSQQFAVRLSNGEERAFEIDTQGESALSIELPEPPEGTAYEEGVVAVY